MSSTRIGVIAVMSRRGAPQSKSRLRGRLLECRLPLLTYVQTQPQGDTVENVNVVCGDGRRDGVAEGRQQIRLLVVPQQVLEATGNVVATTPAGKEKIGVLMSSKPGQVGAEFAE